MSNVQGCAFLNNKIYCYGGILTIPGQWPLKSSSELFSLDIHNSSIQNNINDGWQYTLSTGRSNLASTERGYPQAVPHPDGTSLLITGGITDKENLQTNTILYNASSNSWEAVDGMPDPSNGGERQMYV
jgi:hypothetical protein